MDAAALAGAATEALAGSKLAALPAKQMEFEIEVRPPGCRSSAALLPACCTQGPASRASSQGQPGARQL